MIRIIRFRTTLLVLVALALSLAAAPARAAEPSVRAVLFYSPTCPHCHTVMTESLPPLMQRYGDRLQIVIADVSTASGQRLYQAMVQRYQVPEDRLGVPALVVGDTVLVGSAEIPELLPGLVDAGLARGGVPWPDIPGLAAQLPPEPGVPTPAPAAPTAPALSAAGAPAVAPPLLRDMPANLLALALLAAMLATVWWALRAWKHPRGEAAPRWRDRAVPLLGLIGLGVAGYLTLVETSRASVVCGPVGNCAAVQQSQYAFVLGVPVGALGMAGYAALLLAWGAEHLLRGQRASRAGLLLAGIAALGTLFSIYLTFLEPFVIGATCLWCLSSAALMTALLWLTAPYRGMLAAPSPGVSRRHHPLRGRQ